MKTIGQLCLIVSSVTLAACSTVKLSTDFDRLTTFDKFKTYGWALQPTTQTAANATLDTDLRGAVDQALTTKGLKKQEGKRPDLYAIYHVTGSAKGDTRHYTDWGQPGSGYYAGWAVTTQTDASIDRAKAGALVLDFVDARRRQLVWRSVTPQVIAGPKGDDPVRVQTAVKAMLAGFPPKQ
jgi:Domain of unknown function (DUF4136)